MKALSLPVSEKKNFEFCLLCSHVQNCDPWGGDSFDPRDIICTKLVEIHKEMLHNKHQSSTPSLFLCFNWGRASFDPWKGIIFTNLVKVHKEMLYTKYGSSRPSSLGKKK